MASTERRTGSDGRPYYRARYVRPDGRKGTVKGSDGKAFKFPTKNTAIKAARKAEDEADAAAGRGRWVPPEHSHITLRDYVYGNGKTVGWLVSATADLAESSKENYEHNLTHILPTFGDKQITEIDSKSINAWELTEAKSGSPASARTYRGALHVILADARDEGLIAVNPATRRRGRGRKSGRVTGNRKPQKAIVNAEELLLLGERVSLMSGRDDEFVMTMMQGFTGMRWGETIGLETQFLGHDTIHVRHQLYELNRKKYFVRCPPKDDSYRTIDIPAPLAEMLRSHVAEVSPKACDCHGRRYVFRGRHRGNKSGPRRTEIARELGISVSTVSNALNRPHTTSEKTRDRVARAAERYDAGVTLDYAPHWKRSSYLRDVWAPAATGWHTPCAPRPRRLVPITSPEEFPGTPIRGYSIGRATASWLPIKVGLTRHGLRHTHRTLMEEIGTPRVLADDRMGHLDGSMSGLYSHVTDTMRLRLVDDLTEQWHAAVVARRARHPRSPVPVLDRLLQGLAP